MAKKYIIETFGCSANEIDSARIEDILLGFGFEKAKSLGKCDVFFINTCSVRQKSEDKVYGIAQKLQKLEKKPLVIMCGCMVGSVAGERKRYAYSELKKRTPWVDEYVSPDQIVALPEILFRRGLIGEYAGKSRGVAGAGHYMKKKNHASVIISTGCDNFCAYCVVPYARGEEVSRSKEEILEEIKTLVDEGVEEITLVGQNANSWGLTREEKFKLRAGSDQKLPFVHLLREVHEIAGIKKIDFLSSNPFDFTQDLVNVLNFPKISNYFHIAVQSGNNDVLAKMHRRHTIEDFYEVLAKIRKVRPDAEFGTDIIVGFPGETKDQFMDTVNLFKRIKFVVAYISMYSPRKGTFAAENYEDDVPLKEKKSRHAYLTKVWRISNEK